MPQTKITQKEAVILLHYVTVSAVLLNLMHELKNTTVYRQELKLRLKQVDSVIDKVKDDMLTLFDVCENEFDAIIENTTELTKPLIEGVKPEDWQILTHIKNHLLKGNTEAIEEMKAVIIKHDK